jgi:hypothetical protein
VCIVYFKLVAVVSPNTVLWCKERVTACVDLFLRVLVCFCIVYYFVYSVCVCVQLCCVLL